MFDKSKVNMTHSNIIIDIVAVLAIKLWPLWPPIWLCGRHGHQLLHLAAVATNMVMWPSRSSTLAATSHGHQHRLLAVIVVFITEVISTTDAAVIITDDVVVLTNIAVIIAVVIIIDVW